MLTDDSGEKPKKVRKTRKGVQDTQRIPLTEAQKQAAIDDAVLFFYRIGAAAAAGFLNGLRDASLARKALEEEDFKKQ